MSASTRHVVEPDPAWDESDVVDGVLVVRLSWEPDALAGRLEELVATPALVAAFGQAGITGFTTGAARGRYDEDSFDVEEGARPPDLVRLHVGTDHRADLSYDPPRGLVVSEAALAVLRRFCDRLDVAP